MSTSYAAEARGNGDEFVRTALRKLHAAAADLDRAAEEYARGRASARSRAAVHASGDVSNAINMLEPEEVSTDG